MENKMNRRKSGIDLIKFICSIFVIIIHVAPFGWQEDFNIYSFLNFELQDALCRIAVPFFLICSGYFFFLKTENTSENRITLIKQNIIKILRLYLIWSAIYFPINLSIIFEDEEGILHGISSYVRDFLLTGSYAHLWYLNALIVVFVIVALCLKANLKPKTIFVISLILYLIGLLDESYYGLIEGSPVLSGVFDFYNLYFVTTRNGVFYAFLFFSLGMLISAYKPDVSLKKCIICFIISMMCLSTEALLLEWFSISNGSNMYLSFIPASYFLFLIALKLELPSSKITDNLGTMSKLIFYIHLIIEYAVRNFMAYLPEEADATMLKFILVIVITLVSSNAIIWLSKKKHFHWLKSIY